MSYLLCIIISIKNSAVFKGNTFLNRTGRDLAAGMISMYGPRVTVALAVHPMYTKTNIGISLELTMKIDHWIVSVPQFKISPQAKTFAPVILNI